MPGGKCFHSLAGDERVSGSARIALIARMKTKEITRVKVTRASNGNGGQLLVMAPNGD